MSVFNLIKLFAILIGAICSVSVHAASASKPNIILILTDDMGYADISCNGGTIVPTPNIDRMAKEGIRFTQYYSASPICSPSRAGILTGQYPARWKILTFLHGRAGNRAAKQTDFLDPKAPSIARTLGHAGYATAHIGKWHLGGGRDVTDAPLFSAYGFDEFVSTYESPQPDPALTSTNWIWSPDDEVKRWDRTAYFVDKTLDFLKRHKGQPCFVNLWPDDVHSPFVPKGIRGNGRNGDKNEGNFRAVLAEYDRQIGRLFSGLKEIGVDENTLVIFTSDNGANPTYDKRSGIFRDGKGSLREGGIRMPFIARWPAKIPSGKMDDKTLFHAVDLFPTFCKIAEAELPQLFELDGKDLSNALIGKPVVRNEPLFWEFRSFTPEKPGKSPTLAVREKNWKLLINPNGSNAELYDLSKDPQESNNLAAQHPERVQRLREKVFAWHRTLSSK